MSNENNKKDENSEKDHWKKHNIYAPGVSFNRMATRSQTAFCRLNNSESDLELFCDSKMQQPPGMPPLMVTLKGPYGAIPNTIITANTGQHIKKSENLIKSVDQYKKFKPLKKNDKKEDKGKKSQNISKCDIPEVIETIEEYIEEEKNDTGRIGKKSQNKRAKSKCDIPEVIETIEEYIEEEKNDTGRIGKKSQNKRAKSKCDIPEVIETIEEEKNDTGRIGKKSQNKRVKR